MAVSLAKPIKTQILVNLQALVAAGNINSFISLDKNPSPLDTPPTGGYPFALVGMPRITSEFEDQATNMVIYRFDILFVADPSAFLNPDTDLEDLIDAAYAQFATNFTLAGTAIATVLPPEVVGAPVSTGDKQLVCFVLTLMARTLFTT
jgi:hypothetical protein